MPLKIFCLVFQIFSENGWIPLQSLTDAIMLPNDYGIGIEVQRLLRKGPTLPTMFHRLQLSQK